MPPDNSPSESSPPQATSELYLRQQLEAISHPVPDLAATLSTHIANEDLSSMSELRPAVSHATPLSRSTRGVRQPYLTEDEFRELTSESRRRVHNNLNIESSARAPSIHSYSDRIPARQSLYDWAAAADESDGEDNGESASFVESVWQQEANQQQHPDMTFGSERITAWEERRQREREARRQLEPRDEPSGRVQGASLRNRSPSEEEREEHIARLTASGRSPSVTAALSRLIERQRVERRERRWQREHETEVARTEGQNTREARARALREIRSRERFAQYMESRHMTKPATMPQTVNMIKYLSAVRDTENVADALLLAAELGISTLYSSPSSTTTPSDLLLSPTDLPLPQHSSFLTPGAAFEGVQQAPQDPPIAILNRDRDYLRRMVANRNLNFSSTNLPSSMSALMDAERYIADLVEDDAESSSSSTRTSTPYQPLTRSPRYPRFRPTASATPPPPRPPPDSWPVKVTLHSVSLSTMTLNGSMSASQIPDKLSANSPDHKPEGSSMESFFEGEIIDFRHFSLETGDLRFKSGGIDVDARHWRGVGPFREASAEVRRRKLETSRAKGSAGDGKNSNSGRDGLSYEEEEELEHEIDEEVGRCLGSKDWVEQNLFQQWVLMRWKERCFTSVPPGISASDRYGNALSGRLSTASGCYGLTISGYYYIALHRQTGRVEGLYFDPGSQPYQELRLVPRGMQRDVHIEENEGEDVRVVGIRKWFPSLEVR